MERKFTRGLNKPGMAAQLRESVSQVVRESAVLVSFVFVQVLPLHSPLFLPRERVVVNVCLCFCRCFCSYLCSCICICIWILFFVFILTFCDFGSCCLGAAHCMGITVSCIEVKICISFLKSLNSHQILCSTYIPYTRIRSLAVSVLQSTRGKTFVSFRYFIIILLANIQNV